MHAGCTVAIVTIQAQLTLHSLGNEDTLEGLVPKGLAVMAADSRAEPSDRLKPRGRLAELDPDTDLELYL